MKMKKMEEALGSLGPRRRHWAIRFQFLICVIVETCILKFIRGVHDLNLATKLTNTAHDFFPSNSFFIGEIRLQEAARAVVTLTGGIPCNLNLLRSECSFIQDEDEIVKAQNNAGEATTVPTCGMKVIDFVLNSKWSACLNGTNDWANERYARKQNFKTLFVKGARNNKSNAATNQEKAASSLTAQELNLPGLEIVKLGRILGDSVVDEIDIWIRVGKELLKHDAFGAAGAIFLFLAIRNKKNSTSRVLDLIVELIGKPSYADGAVKIELCAYALIICDASSNIIPSLLSIWSAIAAREVGRISANSSTKSGEKNNKEGGADSALESREGGNSEQQYENEFNPPSAAVIKGVG